MTNDKIIPFPDRPLHSDVCDSCGHALGFHTRQWGCSYDWEWYGPGSDWSGLSKSEGCECPLTLSDTWRPPDEGDV